MIDPKKIKVGELLAVISYVKVTDVVRPGHEIMVKDVETGGEYAIKGAPLIERCSSADQFTDTKKLTKTELAEKLTTSYNRPLTVVFEKADGSERTLRGKFLSHEQLLGRSYLEDMDLDKNANNSRLTDHRTLRSLIVDGVKYLLKGK